MKLTTKQERFAQAIANYEFDFDWRAYEEAYNTKGWTRNSLYVESCKLRNNPKIVLRVEEIKEATRKEADTILNRALEILSNRVDLDIREFYKDDGSIKHPSEWTIEQGKCVADFDTRNSYSGEGEDRKVTCTVTKIKLEPITKVVDMVFKKYGVYAAKEVNINAGEELKSIVDEIKGLDRKK